MSLNLNWLCDFEESLNIAKKFGNFHVHILLGLLPFTSPQEIFLYIQSFTNGKEGTPVEAGARSQEGPLWNITDAFDRQMVAQMDPDSWRISFLTNKMIVLRHNYVLRQSAVQQLVNDTESDTYSITIT